MTVIAPCALTPVTVKLTGVNPATGFAEVWGADSDDGTWRFRRLEDDGTPWIAEHVPTDLCGGWYGTLAAARQAAEDGTALADVERQLAHRRGEHKAQRNPACAGC